MKSNLIALDARLAGRDFTGDSTYWTGLLHGLSELDSSLEFLLFSNGERPPGIPESPKFRWICLKSANSRWWSLVRFPLAARKIGARAIHSQYNLSPLCGRRSITTIHDVSFFIGPEWFPHRDLFWLQRFVPRAARQSARVITVSQTSAAEIERFIPEARGKIEVAYLGPNPALAIVSESEARQVAANDFGLDGPFLLTVGTRWPRKNTALAVQAVEGLPASFPHRLALTGKAGWGKEEVGVRTVATGFVSDSQLSALYGAAQLYLAPSFHEGFGLPLLEAFQSGCPVLCSSGGALPEVAGGAARVMASWEPRDWTTAIEELLGDSSKLESMRELGRGRVAEFSWLKCAQVHERIYREVAA